MGGSASRILDEVRTSNNDSEEVVAKIKHCMTGRRGDINYAGKVNTDDQNLNCLLTIMLYSNNFLLETINILSFLKTYEGGCHLQCIRMFTATLYCSVIHQTKNEQGIRDFCFSLFIFLFI